MVQFGKVLTAYDSDGAVCCMNEKWGPYDLNSAGLETLDVDKGVWLTATGTLQMWIGEGPGEQVRHELSDGG